MAAGPAASPRASAWGKVPALYRVSVDQYHQMIEKGILDENDRVQLLDGVLVEMSPIGTPHSTCVTLLARVFNDHVPAGWHVRVQQPVTLEMSEPEPDLSIVRGGIRDYSARHPTADDLELVVEVADTSLELDRGTKLRIYAAAGVREYWIVDLNARSIERHRGPQISGDVADYADVDGFGETDRIPLQIENSMIAEWSVASMLP